MCWDVVETKGNSVLLRNREAKAGAEEQAASLSRSSSSQAFLWEVNTPNAVSLLETK